MIEEIIRILIDERLINERRVSKNIRQVNAEGEGMAWDFDTANYRMPDISAFDFEGTRININVSFKHGWASESRAMTGIMNADLDAVFVYFEFGF